MDQVPVPHTVSAYRKFVASASRSLAMDRTTTPTTHSMLLQRSQAASSKTFSSFLNSLETPRPDTTKTWRLIAHAANLALLTPCIHICTGFTLTLSELVAVSQYSGFLGIPMDEPNKDFRIAFRRRCVEIFAWYSNSRLPPEGEFGYEIREVLSQTKHDALRDNLNTSIIEYIQQCLPARWMDPMEKDVLILLQQVITAVNRSLARKGIAALQARPPPPPPPWQTVRTSCPKTARTVSSSTTHSLPATRGSDTHAPASSVRGTSGVGRASVHDRPPPTSVDPISTCRVHSAASVDFLHRVVSPRLQALQDVDALMSLSGEQVSQITLSRRRSRQAALDSFLLRLRDALELARRGPPVWLQQIQPAPMLEANTRRGTQRDYSRRARGLEGVRVDEQRLTGPTITPRDTETAASGSRGTFRRQNSHLPHADAPISRTLTPPALSPLGLMGGAAAIDHEMRALAEAEAVGNRPGTRSGSDHAKSAKALLQRQREATAAKFKASETLAKQARLREKEGKEKARRRRTLINRQRRCLEAAETGGATGYGACAEGEGRNAASTPSLTLAGMDAQAVAADMSPSENIVFSARIHANREDGAAGARQQAPEGWSAQSECSSSGSESNDSNSRILSHHHHHAATAHRHHTHHHEEHARSPKWKDMRKKARDEEHIHQLAMQQHDVSLDLWEDGQHVVKELTAHL